MDVSKWGPSGFVLPESVAPFKVQIVPKMENSEKLGLAIKLYEKLGFVTVNVSKGYYSDNENAIVMTRAL